MKTFPIAHGANEFTAIARARLKNGIGKDEKIEGFLSGEKRCPKEGEFYLSGAVPACYVAPNDLSSEYSIVKLAVIKMMPQVQPLV